MKFNDKENSKQTIDEFVNSLPEDSLYLQNIKYDMSGQVKEALNMTRKGETEDWYSKWGCHYLKSLSDAYKNEVCNNFKDKGVSNFTGKLFSELTDEISDVFDNIPPPKRDLHIHDSTMYNNPVDMRIYRNQGGGCVTKNAKVKMVNNTWKYIKDLKKGDEVVTINWKNNIQYESSSKVECLVKTYMNCCNLIKLKKSCDFYITPYHPIIDINSLIQKWQFPLTIYQNNSASVEYCMNQKCDGLYTLIIENRGSVTRR